MKILDNLTHLNPERKATIAAQWTGTFADLKLLTRMGIALLRGESNPIEETAMAKMCNPAKTKHLAKEQRGFLAFESTLDRASGMLKDVDPKGLSQTYKELPEHEKPRDVLIDAMTYEAMTGQTVLVNAYDTIQHARTIFVGLKAKYGDAMRHVGTKTLEGKPRRVTRTKEIDIMQALRVMFKDDTASLGAELVKYSENPAAYVLPGTTKVVETTEAVQVAPALMTAQASA